MIMQKRVLRLEMMRNHGDTIECYEFIGNHTTLRS